MSPKPSAIAVIGSLNIDLVTRTPRMPSAGETLIATSYNTGFGGKGANQAVACARLAWRRPDLFNQEVQSQTEDTAVASQNHDASGALPLAVRMSGAVGSDQFGTDILAEMQRNGVDVSQVTRLPNEKTGVAVIIVEEDTGENRIMICQHANGRVTEDMVGTSNDTGVLVMQLEIPENVVLHHLNLAKSQGIDVVLNPAPAKHLPKETYHELPHLILNESEAALLASEEGQKPNVSKLSNDEIQALATQFITWGVQHIVITLGERGAFYQTAGMDQGNFVPIFESSNLALPPVIDTTGAGDTFVGGYAVAVARSRSEDKRFAIEAAVRFASAAASMTVRKEGAIAAIPWADEVEVQL